MADDRELSLSDVDADEVVEIRVDRNTRTTRLVSVHHSRGVFSSSAVSRANAESRLRINGVVCLALMLALWLIVLVMERRLQRSDQRIISATPRHAVGYRE